LNSLINKNVDVGKVAGDAVRGDQPGHRDDIRTGDAPSDLAGYSTRQQAESIMRLC
jgi:hypothetical protein